MSLDQEAINRQLTLLAAHRRTLAHLLQQAAQFGDEVFAPSQTAAGIAEARTEVARIKTELREGEGVADNPLTSLLWSGMLISHWFFLRMRLSRWASTSKPSVPGF